MVLPRLSAQDWDYLGAHPGRWGGQAVSPLVI